jgi:hypothetical protein
MKHELPRGLSGGKSRILGEGLTAIRAGLRVVPKTPKLKIQKTLDYQFGRASLFAVPHQFQVGKITVIIGFSALDFRRVF